MERIEWLRQECEAQQNALQQTTEAIVKGLTSFKVIVSPVYVSWWGSSYGTRISFEISFVKEDGKTDFGSDIRINFDDNGLEVNYGSCGGFTKYNIYQVERIKLISRLFDHIEDIEKELLRYQKLTCFRELQQLEWDEEYKKRQEEREKQEQARNEVLSKLEIGDIYYFQDDTSAYQYKITRVTPKRVYYEWKFADRQLNGELNWRPYWYDERYDDKTYFANKLVKGTLKKWEE